MILITTICVALLIVIHFTNAAVYGDYISNETVDAIIKKYGEFRLNSVDNNIIMSEIIFIEKNAFSIFYISKTVTNPFSKYYINGYGQVYRWTKGHEQIKKIYEDLNKKK